jgi:hypothetical protein
MSSRNKFVLRRRAVPEPPRSPRCDPGVVRVAELFEVADDAADGVAADLAGLLDLAAAGVVADLSEVLLQAEGAATAMSALADATGRALQKATGHPGPP